MTEKEIEFYLSIKRRIKYAPISWAIFTTLCIANAQFQFFPTIESGLSLVVALFGLAFVGESYYKDTDIAKCHKIIEGFINSEPNLLQKINERKNT